MPPHLLLYFSKKEREEQEQVKSAGLLLSLYLVKTVEECKMVAHAIEYCNTNLSHCFYFGQRTAAGCHCKKEEEKPFNPFYTNQKTLT